MSKMKAFAEKISVEMGYDGELTPPVLREANRILKNHSLERHMFEITEDDELDFEIDVQIRRISH